MIDTIDIDNCKLPDLHCTFCKNLLSVTPILMDTHGNSICGRCETKTDDLLMRNSFYEKLASHFSFPCRFLNEGCLQSINFKEAEMHEAMCIYRIVKCQIKNCMWFGTTIELILHYNVNHQDLILETGCSKKLSEVDGCFMLALSEFYFLMEWNYSSDSFALKVKCLNVRDLGDAILFKYTLSTINSDAQAQWNIMGDIKLDKHMATSISGDYCYDYDAAVIPPAMFSINVELPPNVINKKLEDLKKIVCPNCSLQMVPPILKCSMDHITCVDCSGSEYSYCTACSNSSMQFTTVFELEGIAVNSLYVCRWEGCTSRFSFREIQEHEQVCAKRIYTCIYCHKWEGWQDEMITHIISCEDNPYKNPVILDTQVKFTKIMPETKPCILMAYNSIFQVTLNHYDIYTEVIIYNLGPPSIYGWYMYEVKLQHINDLHFPFNKRYMIKTDGANYSVLIPPSDIEKFNGSEFFTIDVKIILLEGDSRISHMVKHFVCFKNVHT